jgi:hypothetical protein
MREKQRSEDSTGDKERCDQNAHATESLFVDTDGQLITKREYNSTVSLHGNELEIKFSWNGSN